jgi:hypothetical protein
MITTTLKHLREANACKDRYDHLCTALGGDYGDNTPIDLVKILETNGLDDVLWIPKSAISGDYIDRRYRLFAVACCQDISRLMTDQRSIDAVRIAHLYAYGEVDNAARDAAGAAARDAAWDAAGYATWAAARAAAGVAASDAAWAAALAAAGAAAEDRQKEHFRIIFSADF